MNYKNAAEILPPELLEQVQKYVGGQLMYVPSTADKAGWGAKNGSRRKYAERNRNIVHLYNNGLTIDELAGRYYLTVDSIRKIVRRY
ncbi:MAG: CD3324 family protein [Eubacteriales bacterium]